MVSRKDNRSSSLVWIQISWEVRHIERAKQKKEKGRWDWIDDIKYVMFQICIQIYNYVLT